MTSFDLVTSFLRRNVKINESATPTNFEAASSSSFRERKFVMAEADIDDSIKDKCYSVSLNKSLRIYVRVTSEGMQLTS